MIKKITENRILLLILVGIFGISVLSANSFTYGAEDHWIKYYSDYLYEDLATEFTMDDWIGIEAYLPAYNTTDND